ncbi:MAG TPA: DsbA family protein [Candidatus Binatia bacterium]|nr:DsbA family protein [Candidatus Binatia bacterium]
MEPIRLIVHSDYLCPWCYNGTVRLRRLREEFGERIEIEWRSYLLRPRPAANRTLEQFKAYTRSWERPAGEPDGGTFRVWATEAGPPSHSVPPHLVAKAAALISRAAFERVHERLLHAYFAANRDITDTETLRAIWREADLPEEAFARSADPELMQRVLDEHNEAIDLGIDGVPCVRMAGRDGWVTGAQPLELYRRWIQRRLDDLS